MKAIAFDTRHLYELSHEYEDSRGRDHAKIIGVFLHAEAAQAARDKLSLQPGFREHVAGFHISRIRVGSVSWEEGFITYE